jgi:non-heme chloroperoxidase
MKAWFLRHAVKSRSNTLLVLIFVFAAISSLSAQINQTNSQLTSLLIKLKSGITLNYAVQGDPNGPVIVLLHGAGDSWHSFDRVFPLIPSTYRVYAITLRGHGLSDHPESGFSRTDFASDILDFLDQLHIYHATLAGHSLGSFVAQQVAEKDTDHLDRLVLIGSGPGIARKKSVTSEVANIFASLHDPIPYTFARDFQASTIYGPVPAWFFETLVSEAQRVPASTWHGLGAGLNSSQSLEDLKKIHVPTLVLWGDKDNFFTKADEDLLVKNVSQANLKIYPETGHALHWEQPEKFASDLLAFVTQADSSAK